MDIQEFVEKFAEAVEVEDASALTSETEFRLLDEWSSISVMLLVAFFDEEFCKGIGGTDIKNCKTIQDLYNLATN